jgi:DNA-binding response OmpR family regulator
MKILLADDNQFYRHMCETMLRKWGYEVVCARDGKEAWHLLENWGCEPKLALLDWMMPEMDGLELCRRIRATPALKGTYIIMITVKQSRESTLTAFESGADDYISKPFDPDEFQARLRVGVRLVEMQAALAANIVELEQALSGAQKMEAVGRLAGGIAHDFNNLLTIITGASEMLVGGPRSEAQQRQVVQMIKGAAERGARLTRQLLAFSRKQILQPVVLDLNQLIINIEQLLGRLVGEDVNLVTRLDSDVGCILADAGQIEQVLINLAANARDAMPVGGTITLATWREVVEQNSAIRPELRPGNYFVLSMSDTGCGMDRETVSRIFEPFFTTKEMGKGTGLGLATVYGIVKQSGGHIHVLSEPQKGSTFSIYLPEHRGEPETATSNGHHTCLTGQGETILVAEDDEQVRYTIGRMLQDNGYKVLEASDGRNALAISEDYPQPIHLLVTDTVMPAMNGHQLARRLLQVRPALRVLYVSGYTDDALLKKQVLESGQPFLQKPFTSDHLLGKVREVLSPCKN